MNWQSPLPDDIEFHQTLYKYRSLRLPDGTENKYTKSIFEDRSLWFDKPASFNDPFDCNLQLWTSKVPDHIAEPAKQQALKQWQGFPQEIIKSAVDAVLAKPGLAERSFKTERDRLYEKSSVFCWADRGDNIAMFGYYADGHKGVCLEFNIEHRHLLGQAMTVEYQENLPNLDYSELTGNIQLVNSLLLTKAQCWQHEREKRVVRQDIPPGPVPFPPHFLTRVIFGCKSRPEDVELVKRWLECWPSPVILAHSKPDENVFAMRIEDFETLYP